MASPAGKFTLYGYWRSSSTFRVRIALNLKQIPYQPHIVSVIDKTTHAPEYKKINPRQQVPALMHEVPSSSGGPAQRRIIVQGLAINNYIERLVPEPRLYPTDPYLCARCEALVLMTIDTQTLQNSGMLARVAELTDEQTAKKFAGGNIAKGMAAYEAYVQETAGKYSIGDEITMADVFLFGIWFNLARYDVDSTELTTLKRIVDNLHTIPEFVAAMPENQPDYPGKQ